MGHSQAEKVQNRERILTEAADQIREGGLESVSVGKLMKSVNLTHGGFYRHFASRADLLAQALKRALVEGARRSPQGSTGMRSFANGVKDYLSRNHRDSRSSGCAISALVSDVGRADAQAKTVMATYVEDYIASTRQQLGDDDDSRAMLAVSAMVGALALSRVVADPSRSDALLQTVRDHLMEFDNANRLTSVRDGGPDETGGKRANEHHLRTQGPLRDN